MGGDVLAESGTLVHSLEPKRRRSISFFKAARLVTGHTDGLVDSAMSSKPTSDHIGRHR